MKGNADTISFALQEQSKLAESTEIFWTELYPLLRPLVKRWVYTARISSWSGQQEDLIEDIVQETIFKLLNYTRRAEKGEVAPVQNIEHLALTIARNYFRDLKRKDRRIDRFELYDRTSLEHVVKSKNVDPSEIALNHVYYAWVFMKLAEFMVSVSTKQQTALFRDLSHRMYFGQTATSLQQAFADKGLDLKQHQDWKSADKRERSQHAANLSLSYKKIEEWSKETPLL